MQRIFHTPEGVRDIYGEECSRKKRLQRELHQVFSRYGYEDIETPGFEYFEVFSNEVGTIPSKDLYKFFDREGNTLVLRPDFTPSVSRACATYFDLEKGPVRLCYTGNTFINNSSYRGQMKENTQMGVEHMGDDSAAADAEILAMTVECLKAAGLTEFQVSVGQVDYYKSLLAEADLEPEMEEHLRELISQKNYFGVEELLESQRLSKEQVEALTELPQLFGGPEVLKKAESLTGNPKALAAIRRLRELYQVASCYGCEEYISFDLGMLSKYQYYTGIIFQGFTYGTGEPLVTGGRYNRLLEHFGRPAPAIGFCLVMEQVLNALNRQNIQVPVMEGKRLVLYNERNREAAIRIAGMQRTHGMQIQCMRMEEGLKAEDYIAYGKGHQFTDIVSPVGEDQIQVINLFTDEVQMTNQKSFQ